MPKKKTTPKKSAPKSKPPQKKSQGLHFLGVLILFAGFSAYALASYFNSTDGYIDRLYGSVVDGDVQYPPECQTCPDFPICTDAPGCEEPEPEAGPYNIFNDVTSEHPNAEAMEALLYAGIINGYTDGRFKPSNKINRAEIMTILATAVDADLSGELGNCFNDVTTEWFAPFVCYAKNVGWVNGYDDGTYRPAQNVVKAESLKIVLGAFDYEVPTFVEADPFEDVSRSEWFAPHATVAREYEIVTGSIFDGGHQMTRADFVQMVYDSMMGQGLLETEEVEK